jgi:pimeloyl-ACP methyl ester carboxylesterase
VRIPARAVSPRSAIFIFQGGPGQGATKLSEFYERVYRPARKTHDIVLIDQRGTGGSNPLTCDFGGSPQNPQGYFADLFDPEIMRRCRVNLERRADLTQYSTQAAAIDADAVRQALGYRTVDIYGTSYGTRLAMEYARRYPSRVRTLTLKGVVAPTTTAPASFATDVERSVEFMLRDCSAESACAVAFPQLRADLTKAVTQLASGPMVVPLTDGKKVTLSRGLFGATIRTMLQATSLRAELPTLVHQAANGDWTPYVTRALELRKGAQSEVATGLMLSVLCTEDMPLLDVTEARANAAGTILGSYWVDQVAGACPVWARGQAWTSASKPFRIRVPTLLISGSLDPATPPSEAEKTREYLLRSRHIVASGASHSFTGLNGCVDRIMSAFVSSGRLEGLAVECATKIKPPPFKS